MENILVIINFEDIEPALKIAAALPTYRVYTYNPNLLDRIMVSGLKNVALLNWDDCIDFSELDKWGRTVTYQAEAELNKAVQAYTSGVSICGWQHLSLHFIFVTMRWYTAIWEGLANTLREGKIHVFVCDNPGSYFSRSFLPSVLLLEFLNTQGIEFLAYSYQNNPVGFTKIPAMQGTLDSSSPAQLLTYLPTCVYDYPYFDAEIIASGLSVVNIEAEFFNVPIHAATSIGLAETNDLIATLPAKLAEEIGNATAMLLSKISTLFDRYVKSAQYRDRQAAHIANIYRSQLVSFHLFQRFFQHSKPAKILISDHDAGLHGPLIAFAQANNIPVLTVPHSRRTTDQPYTYSNITCLTHPIQGGNMLNGAGRSILNFNIAFPETFGGSNHFPSRITKIALLMNEISTEGIYYTKISTLMDGVRRICEWCQKNDITLSIRCKPSSMMLHSLSSATGLAISPLYEACVVPLAEFAASHDLCLMYDSPTTACLPFLRTSIPILNPIPDKLARAEELSCNTQIIPRGSVDEILNKLDLFVSEPATFLKFRTNQFSNYVSAFKDALPLRAFL